MLWHFVANHARVEFASSWIRAMRFEHVRQIFYPRQDAAELRKILHFDYEVDDCQCAIYIYVDINDVDVFAIEQRRNIPHQSLPIKGLHLNGHGIRVFYFTPIYLEQ